MVTLTTDNGTYNVTLTADLTADGNKVAFYSGKHNFLKFTPLTAERVQTPIVVNGIRYISALDGGLTVSITDTLQAIAPTTSAQISIEIDGTTPDTLTINVIVARGINVQEWLRIAPKDFCNTGIGDNDMPIPMLLRSDVWEGDMLTIPFYTTGVQSVTATIDGTEYGFNPYMQTMVLQPYTRNIDVRGTIRTIPKPLTKHIQSIRLTDTNQPTALVSWSARVGADIINQQATNLPHKQVLWEVVEVVKNYETTELATFSDLGETEKTEAVSVKLRLRDLDAYSAYWYSDILTATDIHVALSASENIGEELTKANITDKSIAISATKKTDLTIILKLANYGTI